MSRILLADDSPQALRLGEQILTAQGLEVVSVTDGAVALRRLDDVKPDLLHNRRLSADQERLRFGAFHAVAGPTIGHLRSSLLPLRRMSSMSRTHATPAPM